MNRDEPTITLPLSALRSLLFGESGDANIPVVTPLSKSQGDLAKVVVTHKAIGEVLKSIDATESFFHVEIFDSHAEIWLEFEWRESNARRDKFRAHNAARMEEYKRKQTLIDALKDKISATRLPETHCTLIANQIYILFTQGNYQQIVKILDDQAGLDIGELLAKSDPSNPL